MILHCIMNTRQCEIGAIARTAIARSVLELPYWYVRLCSLFIDRPNCATPRRRAAAAEYVFERTLSASRRNRQLHCPAPVPTVTGLLFTTPHIQLQMWTPPGPAPRLPALMGVGDNSRSRCCYVNECTLILHAFIRATAAFTQYLRVGPTYGSTNIFLASPSQEFYCMLLACSQSDFQTPCVLSYSKVRPHGRRVALHRRALPRDASRHRTSTQSNRMR